MIFMHGLGDTGNGWHEPMQYLNKQVEGVKVILPTAPTLRVTLNGGFPMPAWYDIQGLGARADESSPGIDESVERVARIITTEREEGVQRIILAGFSQGGAMSMYTGLQHQDGVVGIASLSGYLPAHKKLQAKLAESSTPLDTSIPILMCHGDHDEVVIPKWSTDSRAVLEGLGYAVDYKTYPMGHELNMDELRVLIEWTRARVNAAPKASL